MDGMVRDLALACTYLAGPVPKLQLLRTFLAVCIGELNLQLVADGTGTADLSRASGYKIEKHGFAMQYTFFPCYIIFVVLSINIMLLYLIDHVAYKKIHKSVLKNLLVEIKRDTRTTAPTIVGPTSGSRLFDQGCGPTTDYRHT